MPSARMLRAALTSALALALAGTSNAAVAGASPRPGANPASPSGAPALRLGPAGDGQTSDGQPGWIAPALSGFARRTPVDSAVVSWPAASGVTYKRWTRTDARGPVRIHVLAINLRQKGLRVAPIAAPAVAGRQAVSSMVKRTGAVAGINGDFFDIGNTGAPLGVATAGGKLRHGPVEGWNNALYKRNGRWSVGEIPVVAKVRNRPHLVISSVNSPTIVKGGIGVYTSAWGRSPGRSVTGGQRLVREVVIRGGKVVANRRKLSSGSPIRGTVLIGRGRSVPQLAKLKVGRKVSVAKRLRYQPTAAIGGDRPLLVDGVRRVVDNVTMHPRTAVGVDQETKTMYWVVVDGRSSASRGHTMVELADLMLELGADDALNLDGGGSTTLVARSRSGNLTVRNAPSDGTQRLVPNGLGIFIRR